MKYTENLFHIGWLFIYIFAFGISDMYVSKFLITPLSQITYYLFFCIFGLLILSMI